MSGTNADIVTPAATPAGAINTGIVTADAQDYTVIYNTSPLTEDDSSLLDIIEGSGINFDQNFDGEIEIDFNTKQVNLLLWNPSQDPSQENQKYAIPFNQGTPSLERVLNNAGYHKKTGNEKDYKNEYETFKNATIWLSVVAGLFLIISIILAIMRNQ